MSASVIFLESVLLLDREDAEGEGRVCCFFRAYQVVLGVKGTREKRGWAYGPFEVPDDVDDAADEMSDAVRGRS